MKLAEERYVSGSQPGDGRVGPSRGHKYKSSRLHMPDQVTYWVAEDDLLLEHADHAGIKDAVWESLEAAMGS